MREALVKSRNLVSIRILQSIGLRYATNYVQRFGFERENLPYDLSMALGSGTFSPLQMVRAFAVFSNGGYLINPYLIDHVEAGNGDLLYQHQPLTVCQGCEEEDLAALDAAEAKAALEEEAATDEAKSDTAGADEAPANEQAVEEPATEQLAAEEQLPADGEQSDQMFDREAVRLPPVDLGPLEGIGGPAPADTIGSGKYAPRVITAQNAYIMRSMMREVVQRGTAVRAKALGRSDIAGKTGTTNDQVDAWFSGYNDQVVTTTWVGFDNQRSMGRRETGGRAALPMWIEFMKVALDGMPESLQEEPSGLVTVRIDAETGKRADVDTRNSLFEIFRVENAPRELTVKPTSNDSGGSIVPIPETEQEIVEDIF
jgi:penicillin-binding protein 1A